MTHQLTLLARTAATSDTHWTRFFEGLRTDYKIDRICAALRLDQFTAYLPRVAQVEAFEPFVGGTGLYADREVSLTFRVIEEGLPYLATAEDWKEQPDLVFYSMVAKSNLKVPISLGGAPAVLNFWSEAEDAFSPADVEALSDLAAEVSRSPFQLDLAPVGLSLRKVQEIIANRSQRAKAA